MNRTKASLRPVLLACLAAASLQAYPPAPHHLLYGVVRDELGNPLAGDNVQVLFEPGVGGSYSTKLQPTREPGANYHMAVPVDAGITSDLYKPTALRPEVPFKMRVRIGAISYLPIEMSLDYARLGRAGERTRIDLTLGEDLDGDGIPDAWERKMLRDGQRIEDISPDADADGDGLSNLQEYITGTYAFDPQDGFMLKLVPQPGSEPVLEFTAVRGRTYSLVASRGLDKWEPVSFTVAGAGSNPVSSYYAQDIRTVRVRPVAAPGQETISFYKLLVH